MNLRCNLHHLSKDRSTKNSNSLREPVFIACFLWATLVPGPTEETTGPGPSEVVYVEGQYLSGRQFSPNKPRGKYQVKAHLVK